MAFFHHNILRKYTLAMLSTFNNIEVQKLKSDGVTTSTSIVPIRFSSREKSTIFSEVETSQITNGNFNIIPRASLVFNSMSRASERTTSKFNKINTTISGPNGEELVTYQFNAIPWDFSFDLVVQADGMNEASMILEQIVSHFNPIYTLKINEIPLQSEPSSVQLLLDGAEIEQQEYDEFSSNIVTLNFSFTLRGNIYPPITSQGLIQQIEIFNNNWQDSEYDRVSKIKWERQIDSVFGSSIIHFDKSGSTPPVINNIVGDSSILRQNEFYFIADFVDEDNKIDELTFVWNIISLDSNLPNDIAILNSTKDNCKLITKNIACSFNLQLIITDIHGNISNTFYKNITVV
jgi:hypothetical protein